MREMLSPPTRRARLLEWGKVHLVIDVGANEGQYATRLRQAGFAGRIVSFEPGSDAYAELGRQVAQDEAWSCHHVALGDRDGRASLNVALDTDGSSLLQVEGREVRNSPGSRFVGSEPVRLARLDSIWPELGLREQRLYLKIDTQGTELSILRGASRALLELHEGELSLHDLSMYEGGALFDEVISFLDDRGFALVSLEGIDEEPDTGHMLQVDAIFMRRRNGSPPH